MQAEPVATIFADPDIGPLLAAYADESMMPELHPHAPDLPAYARLEAAGMYVAATARLDGRLVGVIGIAISPALHYSRCVPVIESLFVDQSRPAAGAARGLLSFARATARRLVPEARIMLASAPTGGRAERFMTALGADHRSSTLAFEL